MNHNIIHLIRREVAKIKFKEKWLKNEWKLLKLHFPALQLGNSSNILLTSSKWCTTTSSENDIPKIAGVSFNKSQKVLYFLIYKFSNSLTYVFFATKCWDIISSLTIANTMLSLPHYQFGGKKFQIEQSQKDIVFKLPLSLIVFLTNKIVKGLHHRKIPQFRTKI